MTRPLRLLILVLFLLSGATALVYQVTWLRNLTLIFGASFQATSIDGLSRAYLGAGRVAEAVESLRRGIAINPNDPDMATRLARLSGRDSAGPIAPRPPRGRGPAREFGLSRLRRAVSMALDGEAERPTIPIPGLARRAAGPLPRGL